MCYAYPGPRCSAHATERLKSAHKRWQETLSDSDFEKFKEAESEFFSTPAGFKKLEEMFRETKNFQYLDMLEERKKARLRKLREMNVDEDEGGVKVPNPALLANTAVNSPLSWDGAKPKWWKKYTEETQNNEVSSLSTTPELMDVIDTPAGKMAVVWEPVSQASSDKYVQIDSGYTIQRCVMRSYETGEEVAYIKASHVDEDAIKRSFGDDEFTPFRYHARYSGSHYDLGDKDEEDKSVPDSELPEVRRKVWVGANRDQELGRMVRRRILEDKDGNLVMPHQVGAEHAPDDDAKVQADLQMYSAVLTKDFAEWKKNQSMPFVDYAHVNENLKGQGFGTAAYVYTARKLATQGRVLRGSGIQTADAQAVWKRFQNRFPDNISFEEREEHDGSVSVLPILDFREKSKA